MFAYLLVFFLDIFFLWFSILFNFAFSFSLFVVVTKVCKLLRHIALTEAQQIQAKFTEINLRIYGPQVLTAARGLSTHPNSKIAKENLEVFSDMWQWLSGDMTSVSKEIIETIQAISKPDRAEYLSLPRPGVSTSPVPTPDIK